MAKLGVSGVAKLQARLEEIAGAMDRARNVRVGFLEHASYPDGTPVPLVAAVNEYGNPGHNQPPRPFFRSMIEAKSKGWGATAGRVLVKTDYNVKQTLGLMGEVISDQLRESIRTFDIPALAESTIARKGFSKPLIDTGLMLQSVEYEVKGA